MITPTITWTSSPANVPKEVEEQVDFLLSLSKEEEYVKLVEVAADVNVGPMILSNCDMIEYHMQEESDVMVTGQPGPKWVSWSYQKEHLSGRFHSSSDGFDNFVKWLKSRPYCSTTMEVYPQSRVLVVCLGIGLLLRDIQVIQFGFGEDNQHASSSKQNRAIAHLEKSQLEWGHSKVLLRMCTVIAADLKTCLAEIEQEEPPESSTKGKKPAFKRQRKLPERYGSTRYSFQ
jgi:hypothetical protein